MIKLVLENIGKDDINVISIETISPSLNNIKCWIGDMNIRLKRGKNRRII